MYKISLFLAGVANSGEHEQVGEAKGKMIPAGNWYQGN